MSDFTICIEHRILNEALKDDYMAVQQLTDGMYLGELKLFAEVLDRLRYSIGVTIEGKSPSAKEITE